MTQNINCGYMCTHWLYIVYYKEQFYVLTGSTFLPALPVLCNGGLSGHRIVTSHEPMGGLIEIVLYRLGHFHNRY